MWMPASLLIGVCDSVSLKNTLRVQILNMNDYLLFIVVVSDSLQANRQIFTPWGHLQYADPLRSLPDTNNGYDSTFKGLCSSLLSHVLISSNIATSLQHCGKNNQMWAPLFCLISKERTCSRNLWVLQPLPPHIVKQLHNQPNLTGSVQLL